MQLLSALLDAVPDANSFVSPAPSLPALVKRALKVLHDHAAASASTQGQDPPKTGSTKSALLVDGFDAEQIWLQLDAAGSSFQRRARKLLKDVGHAPTLLSPETEEDIDDLLAAAKRIPGEGDQDAEDLQEASSSGSEEESDDAEAPSRRKASKVKKRAAAEEEAEDEAAPAKRKRAKLPTEDDFFNLDDMEKFVEDAEREAAESDEEDNADQDSKDDDEDDDVMDDDDEEDDLIDDDDAGDNDLELDEEAELEGELGSDALEEDDEDDDSDPDRLQNGAMLREAADGEAADEDGCDSDALADGRYGPGASLAGTSDAKAKDLESMTPHERRMARMAERVKTLEEANMSEKAWYLRGEAGSGARPLNSALEVDLDFERAMLPPPQPSTEAMHSLEEMIKQRIADHRFEDPPRVAPVEKEKPRPQLELDDSKSKKGLGDIYEADYVHKAVQEVPALAMEEVNPMMTSTAGQQLPEEALAAWDGSKRALKLGEDELSRPERKRKRAAKKAAGKKKRAAEGLVGQEADRNIIGRKSESQQQKGKKSKGEVAADTGKKGQFSKSSALFGMLQDRREGKEAAVPRKRGADKAGGKASSAWKL
ncbi:hypothetical protein WJX73_007735 [Symbiochloris irregularis]|uniref:Uncharacterized protein n=1 Tax=Symbiochloris irregularis TaxID=706552 RepID=A0AAW1P2U4_9CHLO